MGVSDPCCYCVVHLFCRLSLLILLLFTFWMRVSNFEMRFAAKRTRRRCGPFYIYTVPLTSMCVEGIFRKWWEKHTVKIWKIHSISCVVSCCFVCAFVGPKRFPVSQGEAKKKKISSNSLKVCSGSMGDERKSLIHYSLTKNSVAVLGVGKIFFARRERKLGYRRSLRREQSWIGKKKTKKKKPLMLL